MASCANARCEMEMKVARFGLPCVFLLLVATVFDSLQHWTLNDTLIAHDSTAEIMMRAAYDDDDGYSHPKLVRSGKAKRSREIWNIYT